MICKIVTYCFDLLRLYTCAPKSDFPSKREQSRAFQQQQQQMLTLLCYFENVSLRWYNFSALEICR
jgi:hypothetical protein